MMAEKRSGRVLGDDDKPRERQEEAMEAHMLTKALMLERAKEIRREISQIFLDAESWNSLHPHEEPIDADPDGELSYALAELQKRFPEPLA
jgi:hypothetical protein